MSNTWLKYNISQQTYQPKSVNDVISNKYDIIHNALYEDAKLQAILYAKDENDEWYFEHKKIDKNFDSSSHNLFLKYNKANNTFDIIDDPLDANYYIELDNYRITELSQSNNYLSPSKIFVTKRGIKRNAEGIKIIKFEIDLTKYWKHEFELINNYTNPESKITNSLEDWYKYNDIINYDYIRSKATLENRVETKCRKVSFDNISINDGIKIDYKL